VMAMTEQGPGDGTLEVVPLVSEAMAYVLLRPFQHDVPVHQLCGVNDTGGGDTLEITSRLHSDGVYACTLFARVMFAFVLLARRGARIGATRTSSCSER